MVTKRKYKKSIAKYYKVWDKENGKYKGIWRIGANQNRIPSLFKYERLPEELEKKYEEIRNKKIYGELM